MRSLCGRISITREDRATEICEYQAFLQVSPNRSVSLSLREDSGHVLGAKHIHTSKGTATLAGQQTMTSLRYWAQHAYSYPAFACQARLGAQAGHIVMVQVLNFSATRIHGPQSPRAGILGGIDYLDCAY